VVAPLALAAVVVLVVLVVVTGVGRNVQLLRRASM
jgi:hypothetical protein